MRKYGNSADDVLTYAEESRSRLTALEEFEADEEALAGRVDTAQAAALSAAGRLSAARRRLAPAVAARVEQELRGLAMPHATFSIVVSARGEGWDALATRGADEVEFLFGANPGVPPRPLRESSPSAASSRWETMWRR